MKKKIIDNIKTIFYALIIALFIRCLFFQPFYIPSSSMEPNLLIGDRLFVSKYSYGYSRHSLPFSPKIYNKRILGKVPERGDIIVFKTPADNRTDYIKRLIGLPGDSVQIINQDLYINNVKVKKRKVDNSIDINCGNEVFEPIFFEETLPNGKKYVAAYRKEGTMKNSDEFIIPKEHFFFMGDNRDCSKDSRYLSSVGYVNFNNLVGKAQLIFFSNNKKRGSFFKFWKWNQTLRFDRFLKKNQIMQNILKFEANLNIKFKNRSLLIAALTHKSANQKVNNEKLEFLGDRVIGLVLSKKIFDLYPNVSEGVLDKRFASLVNKKNVL